MSAHALCSQETLCRLHSRQAVRRQAHLTAPKGQRVPRSSVCMAAAATEKTAVSSNGVKVGFLPAPGLASALNTESVLLRFLMAIIGYET
jgi:hypothetical protein